MRGLSFFILAMVEFSIPPHFMQAAIIFRDELRAHIERFEAVLAAGNLKEVANEIAQRFHLIKGASGFFEIRDLKESATQLEKLFEDKNVDEKLLQHELQSALTIARKSLENLKQL